MEASGADRVRTDKLFRSKGSCFTSYFFTSSSFVFFSGDITTLIFWIKHIYLFLLKVDTSGTASVGTSNGMLFSSLAFFSRRHYYERTLLNRGEETSLSISEDSGLYSDLLLPSSCSTFYSHYIDFF